MSQKSWDRRNERLETVSENPEESLCARDKAENEYWMLVIFRPSGGTALKTVRILSFQKCTNTA